MGSLPILILNKHHKSNTKSCPGLSFQAIVSSSTHSSHASILSSNPPLRRCGSFIFSESSPLQVLTKDSVTVSVDAVVYYRVSNATVSVANVENAHHSTRLLAQTTLRNVLGTKDLAEILSERESISNSMQVNSGLDLLLPFFNEVTLVRAFRQFLFFQEAVQSKVIGKSSEEVADFLTFH